MPPKRPSPIEEPPSASSSGEEEEEESEEEQEQASTDGGDEEEGSEEEDESEHEEEKQQQQPPSKLSSPPPKKPEQQQRKKPEPETESETETESESDQENVAVKPIASKPMEETAPNKKVRSEPAANKPELAKSAKRAGEEVEVEGEKNNDAKRVKKENRNTEIVSASPAVSSPGDAKKTLFQRLWSEEDEIVILKGILEFKEKKGIDVTKDMGAFYEFIKKSLDCDGTLAQMKDKISRLRRKFEKSVKRGKLGENKKFSREHDQLAFDLSKKIWGSERVGGTESKVNGKAKKGMDSLKAELGVSKVRDGEKKRAVKFEKGLIRVGGMEEYVVKRGLDAVGGAKRLELEEKWKKLHEEELELFLKRNELLREEAKLILAAHKADDDED